MEKKAAVIFYSRTGNTEAMAEAAAVGIKDEGGSVFLSPVEEAEAEKIGKNYNCIALGCSAQGREQLEESRMRPFFDALKPFLPHCRIAVFGSCGWSDGRWLAEWETEIKENGGHIIHPFVLSHGRPDENVLQLCEELGRMLVKS
jgi:flavodoxin I